MGRYHIFRPEDDTPFYHQHAADRITCRRHLLIVIFGRGCLVRRHWMKEEGNHYEQVPSSLLIIRCDSPHLSRYFDLRAIIVSAGKL